METTTFDGYVRVSRVGGRGGASFISPVVQRETIERLASLHRLNIGEIVEELDVSGARPIDDRELGRLVRKVEAGESGGLLVWKVSRFSRNLLDGAAVAARVREAGGAIIGEDLDSRQPMGRAILGFLLGWAEEERDARRRGWREAQERAAARGAHPTRTPVGYARGRSGVLVPDPKVAPVVAEVFRARARGASLQECADKLEAATGRGWSRAGVRQMFKSETYLGHIRIGEDILHESVVPALVDERTWQLAQRDGERPRHDGSLASQGILTGLIRCAGCGHVLTVTASGPPGARVASYTCRKRRASGTCPAPASAVVFKVDPLVEQELDERVSRDTLEDALNELYDAQMAYSSAVRELDDFLAGALVTELGSDLYAREVARRRERVRATGDRYRAALDAQDAMTLSDGSALDQRREIARQLIASVTLRKAERGRWDPVEERLQIVWKGVR
jgi:DNA invertase Pin-like site-specific DNA recombinase